MRRQEAGRATPGTIDPFHDRPGAQSEIRPFGPISIGVECDREADRNQLSSDSVVGQRMAMSFAIEHHDRLVDGIIEVCWACESLVSKMMLLQIAPELFDRVVMMTLQSGFPLRRAEG